MVIVCWYSASNWTIVSPWYYYYHLLINLESQAIGTESRKQLVYRLIIYVIFFSNITGDNYFLLIQYYFKQQSPKPEFSSKSPPVIKFFSSDVIWFNSKSLHNFHSTKSETIYFVGLSIKHDGRATISLFIGCGFKYNCLIKTKSPVKELKNTHWRMGTQIVLLFSGKRHYQ